VYQDYKREEERLMYQKEVERKRRNNISEGIDQLVQIMGIPELEKAGKSVLQSGWLNWENGWEVWRKRLGN
jgi:hypothetical protein